MPEAPLTERDIERAIIEMVTNAKEDGLTDPEMAEGIKKLEQIAIHAALFELWNERQLLVGYDRHRDALTWRSAGE